MLSTKAHFYEDDRRTDRERSWLTGVSLLGCGACAGASGEDVAKNWGSGGGGQRACRVWSPCPGPPRSSFRDL